MVFIMGMVGTLFCVSMVPTTAASISIEGKNLWILKGAPVPSSVIFKAKVLASITFTGVLTTISTVIFAFAIRMNIVQFILYLAVGLIGCVLMALFGLMMNLKFPKLDAVNEIYIYKQSASVGFMVLVGFVISILAAAVLLVLTYTVNVYAASLITAAIMLILIFACVHNLEHKGKTAFERL
jgi:ABC-2 type transport system permease protein